MEKNQLASRLIEGEAPISAPRRNLPFLPGAILSLFLFSLAALAWPGILERFVSLDWKVGDMRPDNKKYRLAIRLWQRLPLPLANALGPAIVRGIP